MSLQNDLKDALKYVKRELPFGSRNLKYADPRAKKSIKYSRKSQANFETASERVQVIRRYLGGNCMEMAYLTFDYLRKMRPGDGIRLVTIDQHMSVGVKMDNYARDVAFSVSELPEDVLFCDLWLAGWVAGEQKDGAAWIEADDTSGIYTRDRFAALMEREGEDPDQGQVVRDRQM